MTNVDAGDTGDPEDILFDAVLRPYRSLSPKGFRWLMGSACLLSGIIGFAFVIRGAWPVFGFCGLEMVVLYFALRHNYASGRSWERRTLTDRALTVTCGGPTIRPGQWNFKPQWLTVTMADPPRHESQLRIASHGKKLTIGRFLTPKERLEVAEALRAALEQWRAPLHLRPT